MSNNSTRYAAYLLKCLFFPTHKIQLVKLGPNVESANKVRVYYEQPASPPRFSPPKKSLVTQTIRTLAVTHINKLKESLYVYNHHHHDHRYLKVMHASLNSDWVSYHKFLYVKLTSHSDTLVEGNGREINGVKEN